MWKSALKTGGHRAISWVLEVKRSKILQKLNIRYCFCLHSWFNFLCFSGKNLIYKINVWFNFVPGIFFEQDHLLKFIILEVYAKRWPEWVRISKQKLMWPKIRSMNFCLTLTVRKHFGGTEVRGYFLKKRKLCMQNLTKERKQRPVVTLQKWIFTIHLFGAWS